MATPNRVGQVNGAGDTNALFLKVYAGEVLTAWDEVNVMKDLHMVRTISSGKSASFPATWKTGAAYHVAGAELTGSQSVLHNERIIHVDEFLISDIFVAKIDELKNHYDIRQEYSKQQGAALARAFDQKTLQVAILAAHETTPTVTGAPAGTRLVNASMATDAAILTSNVYKAAQTFDENDIPDMDRNLVVRPAQYYLLLGVDKLVSTDYSSGNGNYSKGEIKIAAGMALWKSNHIPSTVVSAVTGENNTYAGDFTASVAAAFHRSAVGTVKMMDLAVSKTADDGDYMVTHNGTLLTAKYLMGHGILRPEAAIEFATL